MYLEISNPMDYHVALYIRLSKEDESEGRLKVTKIKIAAEMNLCSSIVYLFTILTLMTVGAEPVSIDPRFSV